MTGRDARVARWYELTRRVLPDMAAAHAWPIALDHCFMRVCLDHAIGAPWPTVVARPAVRHLTDAQLDAAIAVAESIAATPEVLPELNASSLARRKRPGGVGSNGKASGESRPQRA